MAPSTKSGTEGRDAGCEVQAKLAARAARCTDGIIEMQMTPSEHTSQRQTRRARLAGIYDN